MKRGQTDWCTAEYKGNTDEFQILLAGVSAWRNNMKYTGEWDKLPLVYRSKVLRLYDQLIFADHVVVSFHPRGRDAAY